jgi:hypothetical protein
MSVPTGAPAPRTKVRSAIGIAAIALGELIAIGVAALFLTLTGVGRTTRLDAIERHRGPACPRHLAAPIPVRGAFSARPTPGRPQALRNAVGPALGRADMRRDAPGETSVLAAGVLGHVALVAPIVPERPRADPSRLEIAAPRQRKAVIPGSTSAIPRFR